MGPIIECVASESSSAFTVTVSIVTGKKHSSVFSGTKSRSLGVTKFVVDCLILSLTLRSLGPLDSLSHPQSGTGASSFSFVEAVYLRGKCS